jgi:DNA-directed RNA polymerase subunit RPC12/RpoP
MFDMDLFNRVPQIMEGAKSYRCILCGKDVEKLYPNVFKVNKKNYEKIKEIRSKESNFKLIKTETHIPQIDGTLDDINLKPILGYSFDINIDVCFDCVDCIGWRHKFKLERAKKIYATKIV